MICVSLQLTFTCQLDTYAVYCILLYYSYALQFFTVVNLGRQTNKFIYFYLEKQRNNFTLFWHYSESRKNSLDFCLFLKTEQKRTLTLRGLIELQDATRFLPYQLVYRRTQEGERKRMRKCRKEELLERKNQKERGRECTNKERKKGWRENLERGECSKEE